VYRWLIHLELQATLENQRANASHPSVNSLPFIVMRNSAPLLPRKYREALRWYRMADDEQTQFGGKWDS
jgi:hypothetical protein